MPENYEELGFSAGEWGQFSRQEHRVILLSRVHTMTEDEIRAALCWPCDPMGKTTWRGIRAKMMRKMALVRKKRGSQNP